MTKCELKLNEGINDYFEKEIFKMESALLSMKLSKPALRALIRLNVYFVDDFKQIDREALKNAHGIGPSAMRKLQPYLL
jgi:hypothetical protein